MRRRDFIALACGTVALAPLTARGQQLGRMRRVAILTPFTGDDAEGRAMVSALQQGLDGLGWAEGRNIRLEYRWGGGNVERTRAYAAELVGLSPDLIFAFFNTQLASLSRETRTIPIVFVGASDPIGAGYVASFAKPSGNITGFTLYEPSLAGKWLGILKEIAPDVARVAIMVNPETAILGGTFYRDALKTAAATFDVESITANVHSVGEIEATIGALGRQPNCGLILGPDTFTVTHAELIIALAARHHVPAIYAFRQNAKSGGLVSYGPDSVDTVRHATSYIDRILKGEKPADLPVQAPTKFELVINARTAKTLGLAIPQSFFLRADEVIE